MVGVFLLLLLVPTRVRADTTCVELKVTNPNGLRVQWQQLSGHPFKLRGIRGCRVTGSASLEAHVETLLVCALTTAYYHVLDFRTSTRTNPDDCADLLYADLIADARFPMEGSATLRLSLRGERTRPFEQVLVTVPRRRNDNDDEVQAARDKAATLLFGNMLAIAIRDAVRQSRLRVFDNIKFAATRLDHRDWPETWLDPDPGPGPRPVGRQLEKAFIVLRMEGGPSPTTSDGQVYLPVCWSLGERIGGPRRSTVDQRTCPSRPDRVFRGAPALTRSPCRFSIAKVLPD